MYYVSGNHEASSSEYDTLKARLETADVTVLEDEAVSLERDGEAIAILGLADPDFSVKGDLFGEVPAMFSTKLNQLMEQETAYSVLLSQNQE